MAKSFLPQYANFPCSSIYFCMNHFESPSEKNVLGKSSVWEQLTDKNKQHNWSKLVNIRQFEMLRCFSARDSKNLNSEGRSLAKHPKEYIRLLLSYTIDEPVMQNRCVNSHLQILSIDLYPYSFLMLIWNIQFLQGGFVIHGRAVTWHAERS